MRFWDASALMPLLLDEAASRSVRPLFGRGPSIMTWWGTRVECAAAIARLIRERRLDATGERLGRERQADLFDGADEVEAAEGVRERAERLLAIHALRAADALQLAAALVWARERPSGLDFVCLDGRLREAARREGFTILPSE